MAAWKTRGLRGSFLEDLINRTNEKYRERGLALIQKVPTPITPMRIDRETRHITLAYFNQKSTVDYIGVVQGIPVCFDAKECAGTTFSLQNVHPHQVQFMREFEQQDGVAFFLLYYSKEERYIYLPFRHFMVFWERAQEGGRRSFRMEELDLSYTIHAGSGLFIPYLDLLNRDLQERPDP
ncbi:MAG: Holliday junction resolvase RecU [Eubacteriales bacterium]|nr:Holliday junction resolvase RecU [Eubacteriales bacterium]